MVFGCPSFLFDTLGHGKKEADQELTNVSRRTSIVVEAISVGNLTVEQAEKIDALVCYAPGIDPEDPPPFFIFDYQSFS